MMKTKTGVTALRAYLRRLPSPAARAQFAHACGTTLNYLRKCLSRKHFHPDAALCIAIERESGGAIRCEQLRPDADWEYLRKAGAANDAQLENAA